MLHDFVRRPAVLAASVIMVLRALTLGSRFLLSLLLARMLPASELGQYGLITAFLAFALLGVGLEFYSYTLRKMVPADPAQRVRIVLDQIALAAIMLGITAGGAGVAVWLGLVPVQLAAWFLVILITEHLSLEATRILIIVSRPIRAYIGVFLRGGVWVFVIGVLMFAMPSARNLELVLLCWAIGGVVSVVFAAFSLNNLPWGAGSRSRPDWLSIGNGLRTARPFMLTAVGALTLSYVDRFVIAKWLGQDELGIYTLYSTIAIGILSLGASISHQFLPKVIAGYAADATSYRRVLWSYSRFLGVTAAAVVVIAGVAIWPVVAVLGLDTYVSGLSVFYVMLVGVFVRILADIPSYALYAAHADKELLVCNLGAAVISVGLNLLLIPSVGLIGAAYANVVASVVLFCTLGVFARRRVPGGLSGTA